MDYQKLFLQLLLNHIKMGYLRNKKIFQILKELPLEAFFTHEQLKWFVLRDRPVLFFYKNDIINRTVSAPHMISMITTLLELNETDRVLFLGAKGGYLEAVISKVVKSITILEEQPEIAKFTKEKLEKSKITNFNLFIQNPLFGLKKKEKFSKILLTGAIPLIPYTIISNLELNGIIVAPFILKNINLQSILQIIKRQDSFQVANFGSVIFSPLYVLELPKLDKKRDLTYEKILSYVKISNLSNSREATPFFEEFNQLPKIQFGNPIFHKNHSFRLQRSKEILNSLKTSEDLVQINIKNNFIKVISEKIDIIFYNPESVSFTIDLEIHYKYSNYFKRISQIHLNPNKETIFSFDIVIPVEPGNYNLEIVGVTEKNYRITQQIQKLQVFHDEKSIIIIFEPT
ncbi:MAG: protein-L-isoaspartate O-methyltransferase [Candidatus Lokiarchaeota archaeon]|nr:protein-L-isoaspartate O-methyltransferase [Candidatus Harpocratesius repetitus]